MVKAKCVAKPIGCGSVYNNTSSNVRARDNMHEDLRNGDERVGHQVVSSPVATWLVYSAEMSIWLSLAPKPL